jgi:hypothetical protein
MSNFGKYMSVSREQHTCRIIEIKEIDKPYFIKLHENVINNEWNIIDFFIDNNTTNDILNRAKIYSKNISVLLDESVDQYIIDFFKKNNIRVKMQINFDYE